jgi:hypothetical protein
MKATEIIGTKLLFVEGKDECNFFKALLDDLELNNSSVQIISVEGKGNFPS